MQRRNVTQGPSEGKNVNNHIKPRSWTTIGYSRRPNIRGQNDAYNPNETGPLTNVGFPAGPSSSYHPGTNPEAIPGLGRHRTDYVTNLGPVINAVLLGETGTSNRNDPGPSRQTGPNHGAGIQGPHTAAFVPNIGPVINAVLLGQTYGHDHTEPRLTSSSDSSDPSSRTGSNREVNLEFQGPINYVPNMGPVINAVLIGQSYGQNRDMGLGTNGGFEGISGDDYETGPTPTVRFPDRTTVLVPDIGPAMNPVLLDRNSIESPNFDYHIGFNPETAAGFSPELSNDYLEEFGLTDITNFVSSDSETDSDD